MLEDPESMDLIASDLRHAHYWSEDWSPDFYVALARAGFISTATKHPDIGSVLIPELQTAYAVLDYHDLHLSRNVAKLLRSGRLEAEQITLEVADDPENVLSKLLDYHRRSNWLSATYCNLVRQLPTLPGSTFRLRAVELWCRQEDRLIAGELGYTIGRTYTSLSGFCEPTEKRWRNFGTLQLVLLARRLEEYGYAFWNLGHPHLAYKRALGAKIFRRAAFLERWRAAIDEQPVREL